MFSAAVRNKEAVDHFINKQQEEAVVAITKLAVFEGENYDEDICDDLQKIKNLQGRYEYYQGLVDEAESAYAKDLKELTDLKIESAKEKLGIVELENEIEELKEKLTWAIQVEPSFDEKRAVIKRREKLQNACELYYNGSRSNTIKPCGKCSNGCIECTYFTKAGEVIPKDKIEEFFRNKDELLRVDLEYKKVCKVDIIRNEITKIRNHITAWEVSNGIKIKKAYEIWQGLEGRSTGINSAIEKLNKIAAERDLEMRRLEITKVIVQSVVDGLKVKKEIAGSKYEEAFETCEKLLSDDPALVDALYVMQGTSEMARRVYERLSRNDLPF